MDTNHLTTQIAAIIAQLHGLFEEIGVPSHERESREGELFTALSETLHVQLRQVISEKSKLTEEANELIRNIKQMSRALEDSSARDMLGATTDDDLTVTLPLSKCLQELREKHSAFARVHRERVEQVKKLAMALESYSSHLESSFVKVTLPPTATAASIPLSFDISPLYIESLNNEFSRVYEEYTHRLDIVRGLGEDIVNLWAEMGTPQAQTESSIVKYYRDAPEQLGLHEEDIKRLQGKLDRLVEEKQNRERRLKDLRSLVISLWDRLSIEEHDRKKFLNANRGCGLRTINEYEAELDKLNELKRQNLHLFVEDARYKLQEMWDSLYFSEEEMLEFTPAFSDVYSDALLSAHEAEIARLEALKEQRAPTLNLIDQHRTLVKDRDDLTASSQDASRLLMKPGKGEKRDPTRLLREEKLRKKIAKDLPKIEAQLRKDLARWEGEYGRPFLVRGVSYLEELDAAATKSLPPRSKTPSAGPTYSTNTKQVPLKSAADHSVSRAGSVAGSSIRSQSRPRATGRSATNTPATSTTRRNPLAASVSAKTSPTKIPARVPLGTSRYGGNSPERKKPQGDDSTYETKTQRNLGPPIRAPPPRMRDLMEPPRRDVHYSSEHGLCHSTASSDSSEPIRQTALEDVYDDRERMSYVPNSLLQHTHQQTNPRIHQDTAPPARYPDTYRQMAAHDARQISSTSNTTSNTAASGSENWETFEDTSESEFDTRSRPAQRAQAYAPGTKSTKRYMPDDGHGHLQSVPDKRVRGPYTVASTQMEGAGSRRILTGSESAWTDEDAF